MFPFGKAIAGPAITVIDLDRLGRPSLDGDEFPCCAREGTVSQFRDEGLVRLADRGLIGPNAKATHVHQPTVRGAASKAATAHGRGGLIRGAANPAAQSTGFGRGVAVQSAA